VACIKSKGWKGYCLPSWWLFLPARMKELFLLHRNPLADGLTQPSANTSYSTTTPQGEVLAMKVMDPVNYGAKMTGGDGADAVVAWPK